MRMSRPYGPTCQIPPWIPSCAATSDWHWCTPRAEKLQSLYPWCCEMCHSSSPDLVHWDSLTPTCLHWPRRSSCRAMKSSWCPSCSLSAFLLTHQIFQTPSQRLVLQLLNTVSAPRRAPLLRTLVHFLSQERLLFSLKTGWWRDRAARPSLPSLLDDRWLAFFLVCAHPGHVWLSKHTQNAKCGDHHHIQQNVIIVM